MKVLRRLRCWWQGHETAGHYGYPDECMHCDATVSPDHPTAGIWLCWLHWWRYFRPRWLYVSFYQRCPDCGRCFDRHDDDVEHIPF